jgi:hypothetical protein
MSEIVCLIEDAEQGSTLQDIENGQKSRAEYNALMRVITIARKITAVVESGRIARTAKTCEHGNCAVAPYNHPWYCDDCWIEMQEALKALDELSG